ncbi:ankyrin repeat domain-containing protein [Streptomyces fulvoviolaceus]|uniref:ankyrin repeat domain-containing protein n=1 Tax=Streptomyces fulvoviolaceus TaxID=285535 RepID=UPI000A823053|nr:ankyrin repeat domain-containing protein [Streptomyces fulvoviolaceus]
MDSLVAAVRRGDADEVRALLDEGADPDTRADGLPLLCLAVAAYDQPVAEALLEGGADPLHPLPDGGTPLLRAVDAGSVGMVTTLLPELVHLAPAVRDGLLARARRWAERGVEAELRRRTGAVGPVERVWVEDAYWSCAYEQFTLGGLTVLDGHAGILTELEVSFRVRTPFDEMLARALAYPDADHAVWATVALALARRKDEETWAAAVALSRHPERLHRLFAADVLRCVFLVGDPLTGYTGFEGRAAEAFLAWAAEERDPEVLAMVLNGLTEEECGPETEALGLSYLAHPDSRVRCMVLHTLERREDRLLVRPEGLAAVLTLARDPDAGVRATTCDWLAEYPGREPGIADALFQLVDEEEQLVRIHAVYGLANRDDPRCVEAGRRIGPVDRTEWTDTWMLDAVQRYERRRDAT